jgi:phosphoglycolate phosphatase-like HAD superfamily hydrolase
VTRTRAVLFDVDNTLLYTGGAGSHAMNRAFLELFGIDDGFRQIEFSGRTDLYILSEALKFGGVEGDPSGQLEAFVRTYVACLPDSLAERKGHLMPGFPQLLEALRESGALLGLATGNFSEGARLKLEYYNLWEYFPGGGFGEVSLDRAEVVAAAIGAVANGARPEDIVIVGDTQHDITAALANGAIAVGVATGHNTEQELRAAGAHLTFADFSDHAAAAELILAS